MIKKLLKRVVAFAAILGVIQLVAMWYFGKRHAQLAEDYALSDAGLVYATTCESRLDRQGQEFSSGRDTLDGCGCMAQQVAASYPNDMQEGVVVIEHAIDWIVAEPDEEPDWAALAADAEIDETVYRSLLVVSLDALGACSVSGQG